LNFENASLSAAFNGDAIATPKKPEDMRIMTRECENLNSVYIEDHVRPPAQPACMSIHEEGN
jgi:hypothetical protein